MLFLPGVNEHNPYPVVKMIFFPGDIVPAGFSLYIYTGVLRGRIISILKGVLSKFLVFEIISRVSAWS